MIPPKPKRPMNPSFKYVNDNRKDYSEKHPEAKLGEITSALSIQYKELSDQEKKKYEDEY